MLPGDRRSRRTARDRDGPGTKMSGAIRPHLGTVEGLRDAFADALARGIARMSCSAPVDRRAPTAGVLRG